MHEELRSGAPDGPHSDEPSYDLSLRAQTNERLDGAVAPEIAERVAGNLLDGLLIELVTLERPYRALAEDDQALVIQRLRAHVQRAVESACRTIASHGLPTINMRLKRLIIRDKVVATFDCKKNNPNLETLIQAVGQELCITDTSAEPFMGGIDDAEPTSNQQHLEFEHGEN